MNLKFRLLAVAAAAVLASCGGGDIRTTAVKVVGDSLNDSGTFGYKFTVQGTSTAPNLIWTERVTAALGAPVLCPRYALTSSGTLALSTTPSASSCTSYGVGGAGIFAPGATLDSTPLSIVQQLKDLAASGSFGGEELLLVDGGANVAGSLIGAYLGASNQAGLTAYLAFLGELLTPAQLAAVNSANPATLVVAGSQYMAAAANVLADALGTHALAKGAQRVVVANVPNVIRTPRFQNVLKGVAMLQGQSTADAVAAAGTGWLQAYNAQLALRFPAADTRVMVIDFFTEFNRMLDTPAAYGLTNVTTPACPVTGVEGGLPAFTIKDCTSASLSAMPPAGSSNPDWWTTYLFSDHFHGTPKTNQIIGDLVIKALESKGWK